MAAIWQLNGPEGKRTGSETSCGTGNEALNYSGRNEKQGEWMKSGDKFIGFCD